MTELTSKQFSSLHKQALGPSHGFSANPKTGAKPKAGYMVALPGHEEQIKTEDFAPGHIKDFMSKHAAPLEGGDRYIGGWRDDEVGEVSMDVSQNIKPNAKVSRKYGKDVALADARTSALDLSYGRNQKAAYDLQTGDDLMNPDFDPKRRNPGT